MPHTKLLIEQWLPIATIGAECMRERGASSALPPLYFLHVWWARRPLTVSRAAILASLLPAYPVADDPDVRPWPDKFRKRFPTFDAYKQWFIRLIGINGDPVAGRKLIQWANDQGIKLKVHPYGYQRAFTINPSQEQLEELYDLLEWTWGTRDITFCDPMAGGGSIPFEALRYGLTVHANELNPVASVILKATLDYPARFGPSLAADIRKYGDLWAKKVRERLEPFFPLKDPAENIFCYVWARTIPCPVTGKPIPLSPNWWLRKDDDPVAVQLIADPKQERCTFRLVQGKAACAKINPDKGTVRRGTAVNPWQNNEAIPGAYIKSQAQSGHLKAQLYALAIKKGGHLQFRLPTNEDEEAVLRATAEFQRQKLGWEATGIMTDSEIPYGHRSHERDVIVQYGITRWTDMFSPRQLLSHCTTVEILAKLREQIAGEMSTDRAKAVMTYLGIMADKSVDYNSRLMRWDGTRNKIANTFDRHDFSFKWSHAEFDAARNLAPWAVEQASDALAGIANLMTQFDKDLFGGKGKLPLERLSITQGAAQTTRDAPGTLRCIVVDPPYYNNVNYAELSDFFYVWGKRNIGSLYPEFFADELTPKDEEATANPARFHTLGLRPKKRKQLAEQDYENKMMSCFKQMHRSLCDVGVLTVMFTHKKVEAWDTLGRALMEAGFRIDSSWPVNTESDKSLHQAKKNAAASTILLTCRKRGKASSEVWWDDLKGRVKEVARQKAEEFEKEGITGVDLYISTFGPVLAIISENWPVLTSVSDAKGNPLPLKPGEALDLARQEVVNRRKQGLLLGRTVEFDPLTDWYLMAWDAFRAQQFPADEARKLALALGRDLEADIVRDKRLVTKKGANVTLNLPKDRRKKDMVDPEAESFPHLIDALHTTMLIYTEEGSKACQVFVNRHGLRNDGRFKALVEAAMRAIPTTRGKDKKFLRPELETLEALRLLFWPDLPAPKEEEPPKPPERTLFSETDEEAADENDAEEGDEDEDTEE
jgi:putative DNA methylase